jgi:hypothetical protein
VTCQGAKREIDADGGRARAQVFSKFSQGMPQLQVRRALLCSVRGARAVQGAHGFSREGKRRKFPGMRARISLAPRVRGVDRKRRVRGFTVSFVAQLCGELGVLHMNSSKTMITASF